MCSIMCTMCVQACSQRLSERTSGQTHTQIHTHTLTEKAGRNIVAYTIYVYSCLYAVYIYKINNTLYLDDDSNAYSTQRRRKVTFDSCSIDTVGIFFDCVRVRSAFECQTKLTKIYAWTDHSSLPIDHTLQLPLH